MVFFIVPWIVLIVGVVINIAVDRHPARRTGPRIVELALLWEIAAGIGYAPSMFQWEVGFGDLALSVLGIGCFWFRDRWMTAAVIALAISYGGDAIGHIMQYVGDGNDAPDNTWAIPSDILQPLLAIVLLVMYRRGLGRLPGLPTHGVVGETVASER